MQVVKEFYKKINAPSEWKNNYKDANFTVITPDNYLDFIAKPKIYAN